MCVCVERTKCCDLYIYSTYVHMYICIYDTFVCTCIYIYIYIYNVYVYICGARKLPQPEHACVYVYLRMYHTCVIMCICLNIYE